MDLFGRKKKEPPAPRPVVAIGQLKEAQEMLEKKERHIEKTVLKLREDAKAKLRAKDKRGALYLLKKAKMYDAQVQQLYGKRANLDIQIMALENTDNNFQIYQAMAQGRSALKAASKQVDVDQVANLMEDLTEDLQTNEEISDELSKPIGPQMDEQELEDELKEMEQEMVDHDLLEVEDLPESVSAKQQRKEKPREREEKAPVVPPMPARPVVTAGVGGSTSSAPSGTGPAKKPHTLDDKEARELKELEAMMST